MNFGGVKLVNGSIPRDIQHRIPTPLKNKIRGKYHNILNYGYTKAYHPLNLKPLNQGI